MSGDSSAAKKLESVAPASERRPISAENVVNQPDDLMSVEDAERAVQESNKLMESVHAGSTRQIESLGAAVSSTVEGEALNQEAIEKLSALKSVEKQEVMDAVAGPDETPEISVADAKPAEAAYIEAVAKRAEQSEALTADDIVQEKVQSTHTNEDIDQAMESGVQVMEGVDRAEKEKQARAVAPIEVIVQEPSKSERAEVAAVVAAEEATTNPVTLESVNDAMLKIIDERNVTTPSAVSRDDLMKVLGRTQLTFEEEGAIVKSKMLLMAKMKEVTADRQAKERSTAPADISVKQATSAEQAEVMEVVAAEEAAEHPVSYEDIEKVITGIVIERGLLNPTLVSLDEVTDKLGRTALTKEERNLFVKYRLNSLSSDYVQKTEKASAIPVVEVPMSRAEKLKQFGANSQEKNVARENIRLQQADMVMGLDALLTNSSSDSIESLNGQKEQLIAKLKEINDFSKANPDASDLSFEKSKIANSLSNIEGYLEQAKHKQAAEDQRQKKVNEQEQELAKLEKGWNEVEEKVTSEDEYDIPVEHDSSDWKGADTDELPAINSEEEFVIERTGHVGTKEAVEGPVNTEPLIVRSNEDVEVASVSTAERVRTLSGIGSPEVEKIKTLIGVAPPAERMLGVDSVTAHEEFESLMDDQEKSGLELESSAEELAQERAASEAKKRLETFRKIGTEQWDDAYLDSELPWTKSLWEALSSEKKPGENMSEKQLFNTLRIVEMENAKRLQELETSLRELNKQIEARRAELRKGQEDGGLQLGHSGMHEQMNDLQSEANDLLLQKLEGQRKTVLLETRKVQEMVQVQKQQESELLRLAEERLNKNKKTGGKSEVAKSGDLSAEGAAELVAGAAAEKLTESPKVPETLRNTIPMTPSQNELAKSETRSEVIKENKGWFKRGAGYVGYAAAVGGVAAGVWAVKLPFRALSGSFEWAGRALSGIDKGLAYLQKILTAQDPGSVLAQIVKDVVGGAEKTLDKSLSEEDRKMAEVKRRQETEKQKKPTDI